MKEIRGGRITLICGQDFGMRSPDSHVGQVSNLGAAFQAALFGCPDSSWCPPPFRPGRLRSRFCCLAVLFTGACTAADEPWDRILGSIGANNVAVFHSGVGGTTKQWLD